MTRFNKLLVATTLTAFGCDSGDDSTSSASTTTTATDGTSSTTTTGSTSATSETATSSTTGSTSGSSTSGSTSGSSTSGSTTGGAVISCSCDFSAGMSQCWEFEAKDPSREAEMAAKCSEFETLCGDNGGSYSVGITCSAADSVGSCFDANTDGGEAAEPQTKNTHYYSIGGSPWDATTAEADCNNPDETWNP